MTSETKAKRRYRVHLHNFLNNLNEIGQEIEEKEKKKEIGKIINSLQMPIHHLINILNHPKQ